MADKKLVAVVELKKPIAEMSGEELDRLADHLLAKTAQKAPEEPPSGEEP